MIFRFIKFSSLLLFSLLIILISCKKEVDQIDNKKYSSDTLTIDLSSIKGTGPSFSNPSNLNISSDGKWAIVENYVFNKSNVVKFDLSTGNRTLIIQSEINQDFGSLYLSKDSSSIYAIHYYTHTNTTIYCPGKESYVRYLMKAITNSDTKSRLSYNYSTWVCNNSSVYSKYISKGTGPGFQGGKGDIEVLENSQRAIVLEKNSIYFVDLIAGNRIKHTLNIVSNEELKSMSIDWLNNKAFILERKTGSIYEVDFNSLTDISNKYLFNLNDFIDINSKGEYWNAITLNNDATILYALSSNGKMVKYLINKMQGNVYTPLIKHSKEIIQNGPDAIEYLDLDFNKNTNELFILTKNPQSLIKIEPETRKSFLVSK